MDMPVEFETDAATDVGRPRRGLSHWFGRPLFLEARGPLELRALRRHPLWSGHGIVDGRQRPVLIIPGFLASPTSADSLVKVLRAANWAATIADVGRNSGPAYTGIERSTDNLAELVEDHGRRATIIGHSRGGQFARILAVRQPEKVNQVIAVGTPLLRKYPSFAPVRVPIEMLEIIWRRGTFGPVDPGREKQVDEDRFLPFPSSVDFVSIYSRSDGIVDWRASIEPAATLLEVSASHVGMINSIAGVQAVAAALARQD